MKLQNKSFVTGDFIKLYEDALGEKECDILIQFFEQSHAKEIVKNGGTPNFTQLNINKSNPQLIAQLSRITQNVLSLYKRELPEYTRWYPSRLFLEEFRVKKYHARTKDRFDPHVDVQDHASARRYLAFLFYLNEDFSGGETEFPHHSRKITPKTGSVIVFPPTWQYPHAGLKVKKGVKYIMSTYCHYY
jgi:hypothetical protein|tara:strand:- start:566 stop:1132 length:567 start_codon:yes stop_codon:yes gene_type:complete